MKEKLKKEIGCMKIVCLKYFFNNAAAKFIYITYMYMFYGFSEFVVDDEILDI